MPQQRTPHHRAARGAAVTASAINRTTLDASRRIAGQARQMRDFGFADVDSHRVLDFYVNWLDDGPPRCLEERYCHSAFEEWPLVERGSPNDEGCLTSPPSSTAAPRECAHAVERTWAHSHATAACAPRRGRRGTSGIG